MENQNQSVSTQKSKSNVLRPALAFFTFASIAVLISYATFLFLKPSEKPKFTIAKAQEYIRNSLEELQNPNSILHQKTIMRFFKKDGSIESEITYEIWEDQNSPRFYNIAQYPDSKTYQVHNADTFWDYDTKANTLLIENYIFENPSDKENKLGSRVIETRQFYEAILGLDPNTSSTKTEMIDGNEYFVITGRTNEDIEETLKIKPETDLNKYYFDTESMLLTRQRYFTVTNQGETLVQEIEIEIIESLERTQNLIDTLFVFDITIPANVKTTRRTVEMPNYNIVDETTDEGYLDMYEDTETMISPEELAQIQNYDDYEEFKNDILQVKKPTGWKVTDFILNDDGSGGTTGIVFEKNNYYISLNTKVMITGGGWGYPMEQMCQQGQESTNTLINDMFERINIFVDHKSSNAVNDDSCAEEVLKISKNQKTAFWAGSMVKVEGSNYPIISRKDLMVNETNTEKYSNWEFVNIQYGYDYTSQKNGTTTTYPLQNDSKLATMLDEMDEIVRSIQFIR